MNEVDLAYCAGLYEGEGTVGTYRASISSSGRDILQIKLRLSMTDSEPLHRFKDIFQIGEVRGPYCQKAKWKPHYVYQLATFDEVEFVLSKLWPWLSPRRREQFLTAEEKYLTYRSQVG